MPSVRTDSQPISVAHSGGDQHRERHRHPPRPAQVHRRRARAAGAEDAERIAGDAGHRHLRQRHHAAVAAEKRERQRNQAQDQRLRRHLKGDERRGHEREHEHEQAHEHMARLQRAPQVLQPARRAAVGIRVGQGRDRRCARRHRPRQRALRAGVHGSAPVGGAHGRLSWHERQADTADPAPPVRWWRSLEGEAAARPLRGLAIMPLCP